MLKQTVVDINGHDSGVVNRDKKLQRSRRVFLTFLKYYLFFFNQYFLFFAMCLFYSSGTSFVGHFESCLTGREISEKLEIYI